MSETIYDKVKVTVVCNRAAAKNIVPLLELFKRMGGWGCTRDFIIPDMKHLDGTGRVFCFDGDGPDRICSIEVEDKR